MGCFPYFSIERRNLSPIAIQEFRENSSTKRHLSIAALISADFICIFVAANAREVIRRTDAGANINSINRQNTIFT
jgi:hypothetical protein